MDREDVTYIQWNTIHSAFCDDVEGLEGVMLSEINKIKTNTIYIIYMGNLSPSFLYFWPHQVMQGSWFLNIHDPCSGSSES